MSSAKKDVWSEKEMFVRTDENPWGKKISLAFLTLAHSAVKDAGKQPLPAPIKLSGKKVPLRKVTKVEAVVIESQTPEQKKLKPESVSPVELDLQVVEIETIDGSSAIISESGEVDNEESAGIASAKAITPEVEVDKTSESQEQIVTVDAPQTFTWQISKDDICLLFAEKLSDRLSACLMKLKRQKHGDWVIRSNGAIKKYPWTGFCGIDVTTEEKEANNHLEIGTFIIRK